jgi:hypothetical protein
MLQCNINLTKGIIWPRKQRVLVYRLLLSYLFIMFVLLLFVSTRAVQQVVSGFHYFSQSRILDRQFAETQPGNPGLYKVAEQLRTQLEQNAARIDSINGALPKTIHTPLPALVLMVNHSTRGSLHKLDFSQQTARNPVKLQFDLIAPLEASHKTDSAREFTDLWGNDPQLSRHFPQIKQLQIRRSSIVSGPVLISQYEAVGKD